MIKLKKQLTFGIFGVLLGVIGWLITEQNIKEGFSVGNYSMSPQTFPKFALILAFVSGLALIIQALLTKNKEEVVIDLKAERPIIIFFLVLIAYYLLFKVLGFIITSAAVACIYLALNHCKNKWYYVIVCVLTVVIYLIFSFAFKIQMPLGWPLNLIF